MTVVDSHMHVWDLEASPYAWLTGSPSPINRTVALEEARPALRRAGVDAVVLVQADDHDEDTDHMLRVADEHPEVAAVVAYVPLDDAGRAASRLEELRRNPRVVGVRNLIHDLPDPDWILRPEVDEGLGVLERAGVTFDLVSVLPRHLQHVPELCARHPDLRIVIDHLSKPPVGRHEREPWWSLIEKAAESPNVYAKVSGLYSSTGDAGDWTVDGIRPFIDHALDVFGPNRLMYGGDWPVSILAGDYDRVWEGINQVLDPLGVDVREQILGSTAVRFYRIDEALLDRSEEIAGSH